MPSETATSDDSFDYDDWVRLLASDARGRSPATIADDAVVEVDGTEEDAGVFLRSDPHARDPARKRRWPRDVLLGRDTLVPYPESYPTDLRGLAVRVLARDLESVLDRRSRRSEDAAGADGDE